jgi:hypothetical protein
VLSPSTLPRFTEEQQTTIKETDNLSLQQDRKFYDPLAVSDQLHSLPSSNSKYLINFQDNNLMKKTTTNTITHTPYYTYM